LQISKENYALRKERYIARMDQVIRYASAKDRCRSRRLLEYFGESNAKACGQCDVCEANQKKPNSEMRQGNWNKNKKYLIAISCYDGGSC